MRRGPRIAIQPKGRTGAAVTAARRNFDAAVGCVVGATLGAVADTVLAQLAVVLMDKVLGVFGSKWSDANAKHEVHAERRVAIAANAGGLHVAADVLFSWEGRSQ